MKDDNAIMARIKAREHADAVFDLVVDEAVNVPEQDVCWDQIVKRLKQSKPSAWMAETVVRDPAMNYEEAEALSIVG